MNYGDGLAYGYDTMKSFADGLHLEDLFVQFAIECITHDNKARGLPEASSVILSVPVMVCFIGYIPPFHFLTG